MQWFSGAVHGWVSRHPWISVGPALLVLVLFIYGYGRLVASVWFPNTIPMPTWPSTDGGRTLHTAVASLVGGIVAIGFGLKPSQARVRAQGEPIEEKFSKRKNLARSVAGLGDVLTAGIQPTFKWYRVIGWVFSLVYLAVGVFGLFAWRTLEALEKANVETAPNLVAALGDFEKVFLSVFVAVCIGVFRDPDWFAPAE